MRGALWTLTAIWTCTTGLSSAFAADTSQNCSVPLSAASSDRVCPKEKTRDGGTKADGYAPDERGEHSLDAGSLDAGDFDAPDGDELGNDAGGDAKGEKLPERDAPWYEGGMFCDTMSTGPEPEPQREETVREEPWWEGNFCDTYSIGPEPKPEPDTRPDMLFAYEFGPGCEVLILPDSKSARHNYLGCQAARDSSLNAIGLVWLLGLLFMSVHRHYKGRVRR